MQWMTFRGSLAAILQYLGKLSTRRIRRIKVGSGQIGEIVKRSRLLVYLGMGALLVVACNSGEDEKLDLAPKSQLSPEVQEAPVSVQEAYRFALANPALLEQIPCYCGCGGVGHTSNYACYGSDIKADGIVDFDYHALG
jgi:hypothetical protein